MSKLPKENRFIDLSDYGRPVASVIANALKNTVFTPIHLTLLFVVSGLIAVYCILMEQYWATAFFLVLKSILDAADGELARLKKTPSYTGRYLDSISDILLNLLILVTIWYCTKGSFVFTVLAFLGLQLQGTLYNYYYVILRNRHNGDTTSRIFENDTPIALKGEKQRHVNILFGIYQLLYGVFDKIIYRLDRSAVKSTKLPKWLMTAVSTFGLGFQLLLIGLMLALGFKEFVIPFFIGYSALIFVFIAIRRYIN
ncbi:CDP-alcohol phosphatidyltransferase [Croceitalea dokdonensis DOKDO 023]|uniref:CDP-alcohol phosphatidyltransferase n=1 Tax=Croceitalea dokdonensis DOKDO 023 TaxID=1300341 RepID=A0A0N8H4E4_9FLAO|nr:CDP-alcohol phosphatidyltransferase family protein [Croceitalea dokdonensis]KPM33140.1 CDP-alcohol phosphatidyltransferase [Croceitalea dokdonensis DOKDO 023]